MFNTADFQADTNRRKLFSECKMSVNCVCVEVYIKMKHDRKRLLRLKVNLPHVKSKYS